MITIDLYRDSFKQNRNAFRETVKSWRLAVDVLDQIQRDDYMADRLPADTVKQMVFKTDESTTRFIIASLVNRTAWDGRISSDVAAWAAGVCDALDEETANAAGLYSKMHPAHLNQIARAMMEYKPEPEPAANQAGPVQMDIKSIYHFGRAWDLLQEYDGDVFDLSSLDDETLETMRCVDDWESFGYTVINGETVIITDGSDGGPVIGISSLEQFFSDTLAYARENMEG